MKSKHPTQPLVMDQHGVLRFKENKIVKFLLETSSFDLNTLALQGFSVEDDRQFNQLLGYSLSGWADLDCVSDEDYEIAASQVSEIYEK